MIIPLGFSPHDRTSPVTDPWQPLFSRWSDLAIDLGFVLSDQHCNARQMLHGGVIAALADNAMGLSLGRAWISQTGEVQTPSIVTTNLNLDYFSTAKLKDWVCISPRVVHIGAKTGAVDALITADEKLIARAHATFRILI